MSMLAPTPKFPTYKFASPGATVTGIVSYEPTDSQVRVFGSMTELKFWPDGKPVMQTRVVLKTADGTEWAIYVKDRMAAAVRKAVAESGAPDVEVGGTLTVTFTELGEGKGAQPPKLYEAKYVAPVAGAAEDDGPPF
jgi:hypothetical protein